MLEVMVARLIPTGENGPGAAEAPAAHDIDRALVGPLRSQRGAYAAGLAAKTLRGLTPFEAICKTWTDKPDCFARDPVHLTSGLNTITSCAGTRAT
jgi:hypothetical protein